MCQLKIFLLLIFVTCVFSLKSNKTEEHHHREKRFLIFNNGGLTKIVLGIACPIDFAPPKPFKGNVAFGWNFQAQFQDPTTVITPLNALAGLSRKFDERKKRFIENGGDGSRQLFYSGVEKMMDNHGRNGKACLLRSICEAAETSLRHNGLIGELFHIFLTLALIKAFFYKFKI